MTRAWCAIACVAFAGAARAQPAGFTELGDAPRPDLVRLIGRTYEPQSVRGEMIETRRFERTFDRAGRVERDTFSDARGNLHYEDHYTWTAEGRLASRLHRDNSGHVRELEITYKLDAMGRVVEEKTREPTAPFGEFYIEISQWGEDGSRSVETSQHFSGEAPYIKYREVYDTRRRIKSRCDLVSDECLHFEYDRHGQIARVVAEGGGQRNERVFQHDYDAAGRVTRERVDGIESIYRWNARGDLVSAESNGMTAPERTEYSYVRR
jgi:hypothetical protein